MIGRELRYRKKNVEGQNAQEAISYSRNISQRKFAWSENKGGGNSTNPTERVVFTKK